MKKIGLILLALLIFPSFAMAKQCGVLEFGTEVSWEYRDGAFFDIDGNQMSAAVPAKKKIQLNISDGLLTIEKAGSVKAKGKTTALKYSFKPLTGKTIQTLKSGKSLIGLFEGSGVISNFLLINSANGEVFRASIVDSSSGKKKIIFKLDDDAFFFPDAC